MPHVGKYGFIIAIDRIYFRMDFYLIDMVVLSRIQTAILQSVNVVV